MVLLFRALVGLSKYVGKFFKAIPHLLSILADRRWVKT
jgi:hypothetical protein